MFLFSSIETLLLPVLSPRARFQEYKLSNENIVIMTYNEARPKERSDRGRLWPIGKKASSYRGAHRMPLFDESVCLVSVCVTFVVFTDSESCTGPISTNPASMEAGKYELTRRTCFVARRPEMVAVAGLLWLSWCVLGGVIFFVFFCFDFFFSSNVHGLQQLRGRIALFTSLLVMRQGRRSEATEGVFFL